MTAVLYVMFYAWLLGAIFFAAIFFACIKMMGGKEEFTAFFNKMQNTRYQPHHIEWALVLATVFWPQVIASHIFNTKTASSREKVQ